MKETIKIALLGVIAVATVYTAFFNHNSNDSLDSESYDQHNHSNEVAENALAMPPQEPEVPEYTGPKTNIQFKESSFDFGNIDQNSENKHLFVFTNTGKEPLLISAAKGSCGCTVPKYPTEPIAPGKTGEIEVVYKPGMQSGNQTKTVTVTANTEPANTVIKISANVAAPVGQE